MNKLWVGLDYAGKIVHGGHNRPRLYYKDIESAIAWAAKDSRIVTLVEFNVGDTVYTKAAVKP